METNLFLRLYVGQGTESDIAQSMVSQATKLDLAVVVNIKGLEIIAIPGDTVDNVLERLQKVAHTQYGQRAQFEYRFANHGHDYFSEEFTRLILGKKS